ncbi:MAG: hypothetical protein JEY94_06035 [Melioribacteraceae bacterium]|nr:hypothetical protein [Melioribacteraceae bacterium]
MNNLKKVILLVETSRAFGRDLLNGIVRYSGIHSPWTFYRDPRGLKSAIPNIEKWDADGIIMRDVPISNELKAMKLSIITVLHLKKGVSRIPSVITNFSFTTNEKQNFNTFL